MYAHRWKHSITKVIMMLTDLLLECGDVFICHFLMRVHGVRIVCKQDRNAERIEHNVQSRINIQELLESICMRPTWVYLGDDCGKLTSQVIIPSVSFKFFDDVPY